MHRNFTFGLVLFCDRQDALEAFESLLACMKGENEELVANLQTERRNGILNLSRSIVPTRLFCSAGAVKANSLSCPFEGWSSRLGDLLMFQNHDSLSKQTSSDE